MKVVALSDLHGHLPTIAGNPDLILLAGDFSPLANEAKQFRWLNTKFRWWLESLPARVVACAGNHDWPLYNQKEKVKRLGLRWTYLEDDGIEIAGLNCFGVPWTLEFNDWAFNASKEELMERFAAIPEGTDIVITHGPPYGFGDIVRGIGHVGSISLLHRIEEVKPRLVVFGHIHEGRGLWNYDGVILANVTLVNEKYELVHKAMEFTL